MTRTSNLGWGSALWGKIYNKGSIKINFQIDNEGNSNCLVIGILKADRNYNLNSKFASNFPHDSWCWQQDGDIYRHSLKVFTGPKYHTGNVVALTINMEKHFLTLMLNNLEVYTFTEIAEEVIPFIAFKGKNQHITVSVD